MKILDEKGRLFGKINVIDLALCIIVLAVVAAGFYNFVLKGRAAQTAEATVQTGEVYLTVKARLMPEEVVHQLKVGDKLVAKGAFQNAEIVSIDYEPGQWVAWTAEGEGIWTTHPIWKDIIVTIKDSGNANDPIIKVGGQEARAGKEFILKTQKVEVTSTVYDISFK